jgi:SAM-dependent methyltransferase
MTSAEQPPPAIRKAYEEFGAEEYYRRFGAGYTNPHESRVREVVRGVVERNDLDLRQVLDLACGSGEATRILLDLGARDVDGVDPYTHEAYRAATGRTAEELSFEDVAAGALAGRSYSLTVCSFALHLAGASRLPVLAWQLSQISDAFLVVTPHKRPLLRPAWGWHLADEIVIDRVRGRCYRRDGGQQRQDADDQ